MHNFVIDNYVVRLQINMSYNLMLTSGKKIPLCATKKKNILTLVLSEKKILNEAKKHNPPPTFKLNDWSLMINKIATRSCMSPAKAHCQKITKSHNS